MDEVDDDPIAALASSHTKRMQEIADEGFDKTKEVCGNVVTRLKKAAGLRDAVVDRTLAALGIDVPNTTPTEKEDEPPGTT